MCRRNGSTYRSRLGSSDTRNRPIAPCESGPCCHDKPIDHLTIVSCLRRAEVLLEGTSPASSLPTPGSSGRRYKSKAQQTNPKPNQGDFSDTSIATMNV